MRGRRDSGEPERYADYDEYANGLVWPSIDATGEIKHTFVDEMAPQHAASAIWKLKRWVSQQWATETDAERAWLQWQRTTLYKGLAARAGGVDDMSAALESSQGLSDSGTVKLIARILLEGTPDDVDPMEIIKTSQHIAGGLARRGYIVTHKA